MEEQPHTYDDLINQPFTCEEDSYEEEKKKPTGVPRAGGESKQQEEEEYEYYEEEDTPDPVVQQFFEKLLAANKQVPADGSFEKDKKEDEYIDGSYEYYDETDNQQN